jgi:hypothetical protein
MGKPQGCRICGGPLSYHQLVYNQICSNWRCKNALLELEMKEHRDRAARVVGIDQPALYPVIVVPDDMSEVQWQPSERKQAHIDFLFDLSVQTIATLDDPGDRLPEEQFADLNPPVKIASDVCSICKGACCHLGNEKAFLDTAALRRFIKISGLSDPLEIVYTYYGHLPKSAVADACVYQTDRGCALPRWMRADICNSYRCQGLQQAEKMNRQRGSRRLCVLIRRDNRTIRSAFIRNHEILVHPLIKTDPFGPLPPENHQRQYSDSA